MNRSEYINSVRGQKNLKTRRDYNRTLFQFETEKLKTKESSRESDKIYFQQCVIENLSKFSKRAYRTNVIAEIQFSLDQENPPLIHSLPKNYLDLLIKPASKTVRRKNLLLKDDRLVKVLIVGYHLQTSKSANGKSSAYFKMDTMRAFIDDLNLVRKIQHGNFTDSSESFDFEREHRRSHEVDNSLDDLSDWMRDRDHLVKVMGEEAFELHRTQIVRDVQSSILMTNRLSVWQIVELLSPLVVETRISSNLLKWKVPEIDFRKLILSSPANIYLKSIPLKPGETAVYKLAIQSILDEFRTKYPILFPLRVQLSVTIFYCPPAVGGIDLDNLARIVIPLINDAFMPPSTFLRSISMDNNNPYLTLIADDLQRLKKLPKACVSNYQIIELPRRSADAKEGFVRLLLEDGYNYDSIWRRIDHYIEEWMKTIE